MPRRHHWTQQVGSGRRQARGSRGARRRLSGDHPVVGGAVRSECGISPPRYTSDASSARAQQPRCVTRRSGMDGIRRRPSQEPAVHRPSFPAAAVTLAMRRWVRCVAIRLCRAERRARERAQRIAQDDSRGVTLSARAYCMSTESVRTRAQIARRRRRDADCVARVSRLRRCRGAQRITALRVHLPPRCRRAAGGSIVQPRCGSGTTGRCSTPV